MSDAPTSGGDRPEAALPDAEALARAGWSEEELTWEQIQESAAEALEAGDWRQAMSLWTFGLDLARVSFEASDPRLAASLTNKAVALRHVWACSGPWVLGLGPERRARSSTFHLRLERRHSRAYEQHARARLTALAEQGQSDTKALKEGGQMPRGALGRWQKERPANYVDARKLLAAVLLLADPPK
jgi:hypothetical protein